jgi:hypothetical protein
MRVTSPPLTEKQKRYLRKVNGTKKPFALDMVRPDNRNKEREYYAPIKASYKPCRLRGNSGTRLSEAKRAMVRSRLDARAAFFAELGVQV